MILFYLSHGDEKNINFNNILQYFMLLELLMQENMQLFFKKLAFEGSTIHAHTILHKQVKIVRCTKLIVNSLNS